MNQQFDEATIRRALYANVRDETFSGSVRTYLTRLLADVWSRRDDFSGKRPFGMSGWQVDVYSALIRADLIEGEFDEDGFLASISDEEEAKADALIAAAIQYLGNETQADTLRSKLTPWSKIVIELTRCEHGRVQGDSCYGCPGGWSPNQAGREVGFSLDGTFKVVVPPRDEMNDPKAWYKET